MLWINSHWLINEKSSNDSNIREVIVKGQYSWCHLWDIMGLCVSCWEVTQMAKLRKKDNKVLRSNLLQEQDVKKGLTKRKEQDPCHKVTRKTQNYQQQTKSLQSKKSVALAFTYLGVFSQQASQKKESWNIKKVLYMCECEYVKFNITSKCGGCPVLLDFHLCRADVYNRPFLTHWQKTGRSPGLVPRSIPPWPLEQEKKQQVGLESLV